VAATEFTNEIRTQLEDDILEYGWIAQIARDYFPEFDDQQLAEEICSAIRDLLETRYAVIGDAVAKNGLIEIREWPGSIDEKLSRVKAVIGELGLYPEMSHGFWLSTRSTNPEA
jgi:hypothetical protein